MTEPLRRTFTGTSGARWSGPATLKKWRIVADHPDGFRATTTSNNLHAVPSSANVRRLASPPAASRYRPRLSEDFAAMNQVFFVLDTPSLSKSARFCSDRMPGQLQLVRMTQSPHFHAAHPEYQVVESMKIDFDAVPRRLPAPECRKRPVQVAEPGAAASSGSVDRREGGELTGRTALIGILADALEHAHCEAPPAARRRASRPSRRSPPHQAPRSGRVQVRRRSPASGLARLRRGVHRRARSSWPTLFRPAARSISVTVRSSSSISASLCSGLRRNAIDERRGSTRAGRYRALNRSQSAGSVPMQVADDRPERCGACRTPRRAARRRPRAASRATYASFRSTPCRPRVVRQSRCRPRRCRRTSTPNLSTSALGMFDRLDILDGVVQQRGDRLRPRSPRIRARSRRCPADG